MQYSQYNCSIMSRASFVFLLTLLRATVFPFKEIYHVTVWSFVYSDGFEMFMVSWPCIKAHHSFRVLHTHTHTSEVKSLCICMKQIPRENKKMTSHYTPNVCGYLTITFISGSNPNCCRKPVSKRLNRCMM